MFKHVLIFYFLVLYLLINLRFLFIIVINNNKPKVIPKLYAMLLRNIFSLKPTNNAKKTFIFKEFYCSLKISSNNSESEHEISLEKELETFRTEKQISVLDPNKNEFANEITPYFRPTFNLAAYVNKSETLKQFIKLGVNLANIEKRKGLPQFVLKLNFETDVKPHIIFLNDVGVPSNILGDFITKNPLIFKENLNDLTTRVNYLESKKFEPQQISRIITKNPFWLMFSTQRIDGRLGFFQKNFELSGQEVRLLSSKQPRLITYQLEHVRKNTFSIKEEMGLSAEETKHLLLNKPRLWMINKDNLISRFDYAHLTMELKHNEILQNPEILTSREFRLQQRHEYLKYLGKAQYNPKLDLYVSPKVLVEGTDKDFVLNIAKTSLDMYDTFLRTL